MKKIARIEYDDETQLYCIYNADVVDDQQQENTIGLESRREAVIAARWAGYTHYITPRKTVRSLTEKHSIYEKT